MKKFTSLLIALLLIVSLFALSGCGAVEAKFGMGVYSYIATADSATADKDGKGEVVVSVAAVLLDKKGAVIDAALDVADNTVSFTKAGVAVKAEEFKTKYEKGNGYGMVAYGGAKKEWFEQADAFVSVIKGKTLDEIKKLIAEDGKGTDEVVKAGCTIFVSDFIKALEKAFEAAKTVKADKDSKVSLGIVSAQTKATNATATAKGISAVSTTATAVVVDSDNKALISSTDSVDVEFDFDNLGKTTATKKDVSTKRQLGKEYGMVAYGGAKKEWFEQVDAFDAAVVGKTADDIAKLQADDGKGNADVQKAGCTIFVTDFVKTTVKALKG